MSLQARKSQLLFFGNLQASSEQFGTMASASSSVQGICSSHHCTWWRTLSGHLQVAEHLVKSQPLLPSACFGAGEFAIQARGDASLDMQSLDINICEEQLRIIVPFACQDSANIFSFLY